MLFKILCFRHLSENCFHRMLYESRLHSLLLQALRHRSNQELHFLHNCAVIINNLSSLQFTTGFYLQLPRALADNPAAGNAVVQPEFTAHRSGADLGHIPRAHPRSAPERRLLHILGRRRASRLSGKRHNAVFIVPKTSNMHKFFWKKQD